LNSDNKIWGGGRGGGHYSKTHQYWKAGILGTIFQLFLKANEIIEKGNLEEEAKCKEKENILQARKLAF
jgi:hypothetical protein